MKFLTQETVDYYSVSDTDTDVGFFTRVGIN